MKITKIAKQVRISLTQEEPEKRVTPEDYLSTGSTLLNLAISDTPHGGYRKGSYVFLVGDSASGKTFYSMTCFAEAVLNPAFTNHRLIYDNVEDGMLMDVRALFGEAVEARMQAPGKGEDGEPKHSETIEEFYYHVDDAVKHGKPFIYVLDSMDGLSSEAEAEKFDEQKDAYLAGKTTTGSYGDGKAKKNSALLRKVLRGLRDTGSILVIISQTRDNLTAMSFEKKTRSGGRALRFYATIELWTSLAGQITKTVKGKTRKIGQTIKLQLKKNRVTGKLHEVNVPIFPSYGIDDTGSMIDYLVDEKWWTKSGQTIKARELRLETTREKLITVCEADEDMRAHLQRVVTLCWHEVDAASSLGRRSRYS